MGSFCSTRKQENLHHDQLNKIIPVIQESHQQNKLKDESEYLKKVNLSLMKEINQLKENMNKDTGLSLTSLSSKEVKIQSEKKIEEFVQNILDNPDTNISWLPDVVERRLYKNITTIVVNLLESTIENSDITFLGHKIRFVMDPQLDSSNNKK